MADGYNPTLVSKDNNNNAVANPIFVEVSDGTDVLLVNPDGSINVAITGGSSNQYAEDSAAVSGDMGNVALVVRKDTPGSNVDTDGDYATLLQDANGRLYTQIHDGGNSITVDAVDLDIRPLTLAEDAIKVSANGSANTITNPIFVQVTNNAVTGEVNSYSTATPGAGATSNHDYTVVGVMKLKSIEFACSGPMKVEIQVGPLATLVTKAVGFIQNAGGNSRVIFDPPVEVDTTGTGTVRVIRTNRANQAVDVYSTILGIDN